MKKLILQGLILINLTVPALSFGVQQGISIHKLNNGLEVLLIENKALPIVGVNVVVKTGSAYETYETSGMSHMLEHLLFNGTRSRTQRELYDETDLIGGYNNANTGDFYTNYMMVMPAEHQVKGMELQADMLFNSILPEDKFEKEKGIVLEEIAQSLSKPATRMEYNLKAELYRGHALSLPTLGTYATIEHLSRDEVYDYYRSTYLPNNMILSAIGNFDSQAILKEIERIYGSAAPGSVYRPGDSVLRTGLSEVEQSNLKPGTWLDRYYAGERDVLHQIYLLPPNLPAGFHDLMELGMKEPLDKIEAILKKKFPGMVESLKLEMQRSPIKAYLTLKMSLKDCEKPQRISTELYGLVRKIRIKTPETTLAAWATKAKTDFLRNLEKPHMFGIYNASILAVDGIDEVLNLPTVETLTTAAKALRKYRFKQKPAVIFHHGETSSSGDSTGKVLTSLIQAPDQGMGVIVKQNSASELLAIHYLFKYKAAYEAKFGKDAARILHECFGQRMESVEKQARGQQFGLKFTVNDNPWIPMDNIYLHPDFGYIRVEGLANDLPGAISFLNSELNGFIPTETEFEQARNKFSREIARGRTDKAREKFDTLRDSVLYGSSEKQADKPVDYQSLLEFARVYFAPGNRIVSIVSPQPPAVVAKLILREKPGKPLPAHALSDKEYRSLTSPVSIDVQGGGERSYLFWGFVKDIEPGDKAALKALSLLLSDKIIFDVREKQGLAYRMTATVEIKADKALFYISLGTRPQNTEALLSQFPELMSKQILAGIKETDIQKAINMYLGRMMFRRLSSINQAYYLGTSLFFHNNMHYDQEQLEALKKVTLAEVSQVARRYLTPENTISIVVR